MLKRMQQQDVQSENETQKSYCSLPLIGDPAPAFVAESTKGPIHFPQDYVGRWVILFSHPSDFTPVCTTEFIMFADLLKEFESMNTELVGLSVDSLSSHIAWLYAIEQEVKFNGHENVRVDFPLIADLSTQIARKYGMLHPKANSTKTVRAVYFIDPQGIIRTILFYPASTGRNFEEIKRILASLQLNDEFGVSTPADWWPGDDVILPNPDTLDDAVKAHERNTDSTDVWFLTFGPMPTGTPIPDSLKKTGAAKREQSKCYRPASDPVNKPDKRGKSLKR